jgi:hypothetical protein
MGSAWAALTRLVVLLAGELAGELEVLRLVAMNPSHQRWPDGTGSIPMGKGVEGNRVKIQPLLHR